MAKLILRIPFHFNYKLNVIFLILVLQLGLKSCLSITCTLSDFEFITKTATISNPRHTTCTQ
eukprot:Pgem_evm1s14660